MGNLLFLKRTVNKEPFKDEEITPALEELCKNKFRDYIKVRYEGDGHWIIYYQENFPFFFDLWNMKENSRLESKLPIGDFMQWVHYSVFNELALELNATIRSECMPGKKWRGEENYYPTIENYINTMHTSQDYINLLISEIPKEFLNWDKNENSFE